MQNSTVGLALLFLCSKGDNEEIAECKRLAREWRAVGVLTMGYEAGPADWARKINDGLAHVTQPYVLLGADDLRFHPGWDIAVLEEAVRSNAGVIGTNDLANPTVMAGKHSTHPLVRMDYIEEHGTIDERGKVLHEGYHHQWVDAELCETAKARGQWAFAFDSHVEHMHPFYKGVSMDATYEKGQSTTTQDYRHFLRRRRLWMRDLRKQQRRNPAYR